MHIIKAKSAAKPRYPIPAISPAPMARKMVTISFA
jgi:hypothetical protein